MCFFPAIALQVGYIELCLEYFLKVTGLSLDHSFKSNSYKTLSMMLGYEGLWLWQETFVALDGQSELSLKSSQ